MPKEEGKTNVRVLAKAKRKTKPLKYTAKLTNLPTELTQGGHDIQRAHSWPRPRERDHEHRCHVTGLPPGEIDTVVAGGVYYMHACMS